MNPEDALLLEQIASHISNTLYAHNGTITEGYRGGKGMIRHDDYDKLRELAKRIRGEDGQLAHEIGRSTLPWAQS